MLSQQESAAIEANLFPFARWLVRQRPDFPWHRDRDGNVTASLPQSSQALAIDLFATIDRLQSRDVIMARIAEAFELPPKGPWRITPETVVDRRLLGESRQTQIDALAQSNDALILFECKFTEPDGGGCSQPMPILSGPNKGVRQCNGNYENQLNAISKTWSRCALTTKGLKYWELIPQVLAIDSQTDHKPCPFAGGWYQWMRNLVAAAAMGSKVGVPSVFAIVFANGPFPIAKRLLTPDWQGFVTLVSGGVRLRVISYQALLKFADEMVYASERSVLTDCRTWIEGKITAAARSSI